MPATVGESCAQFAEHDERHDDRLGFLQERDGFDQAFAQIDVSIGVESDPHFQRS